MRAGLKSISSQLALAALTAALVSLWPGTALAGGRLLVTNKGDKTLSIVDADSNKEIATVAEDGTLRAMKSLLRRMVRGRLSRSTGVRVSASPAPMAR